MPASADPLYASLMSAGEARRRFEQSPWIARHWPAALRTRTLALFDHQDALNRHFTPWIVPRPGLADVHAWLVGSSHRAAPLWVLGSSLDRQEIARDASRRGVSDPEVALQLGIGALVAGDYREAERLLEHAASGRHQSQDDLRLRVYASCRAGEISRAAELIATAAPPENDWARGEWAWVADWCGLRHPHLSPADGGLPSTSAPAAPPTASAR
jgi:hypothetical protein